MVALIIVPLILKSITWLQTGASQNLGEISDLTGFPAQIAERDGLEGRTDTA
jgi:hypothetical protein